MDFNRILVPENVSGVAVISFQEITTRYRVFLVISNLDEISSLKSIEIAPTLLIWPFSAHSALLTRTLLLCFLEKFCSSGHSYYWVVAFTNVLLIPALDFQKIKLDTCSRGPFMARPDANEQKNDRKWQ